MSNGESHHPSPLGFSTRAVWSGQEACPATGATIVPVYQTATFTLPEIGVTKGFDYSQTVNPTRSAMERQLAALEGGTFASAFASGMAAVAGATSLLSCGDHIIATRDIYGGTHRLFTTVLSRYGIDVTFVDTSDACETWAAARPNTRLLWLDAKQSDAAALRSRGALATAAGRRPDRGRQYVCVAFSAAAACVGSRYGGSFDDEIHRRTQRRHRRCGHHERSRDRRASRLPSELRGRGARAVGCLSHHARSENAWLAYARTLEKRAGRCGVSRWTR